MFDFSPEKEEGVRGRLSIPIPFMRETVGSGDLLKSLTDALRIPQCGGCKERQQSFNEAIEFRPLRSLWED